MKIKSLSIASAILVSGIAILLSHLAGARGETLWIIAAVTLTVSCTTAFTAASLGIRRSKKKALG